MILIGINLVVLFSRISLVVFICLFVFAGFHYLANCYDIKGRYEDAEVTSKEALQHYKQSVSQYHPAIGQGVSYIYMSL